MKFIILGNYRTGSTLLQKTISQHNLVEAHHEIFNIEVISRNLSILEDPKAHLLQHLALQPGKNVRAVGFKLMYCQAREIELSESYWGERVNQRILKQRGLP